MNWLFLQWMITIERYLFSSQLIDRFHNEWYLLCVWLRKDLLFNEWYESSFYFTIDGLFLQHWSGLFLQLFSSQWNNFIITHTYWTNEMHHFFNIEVDFSIIFLPMKQCHYHTHLLNQQQAVHYIISLHFNQIVQLHFVCVYFFFYFNQSKNFNITTASSFLTKNFNITKVYLKVSSVWALRP